MIRMSDFPSKYFETKLEHHIQAVLACMDTHHDTSDQRCNCQIKQKLHQKEHNTNIIEKIVSNSYMNKTVDTDKTIINENILTLDSVVENVKDVNKSTLLRGRTDEEKTASLVKNLTQLELNEDFIQYKWTDLENDQNEINKFKDKIAEMVFGKTTPPDDKLRIVHIIYDQFPLSLLEKIVDDVRVITNTPPQEVKKVRNGTLFFDTACLATYHDPAPRSSTNKLHISATSGKRVPIWFSDVDFYLKNDAHNLISMEQNFVHILAKSHNQQNISDLDRTFGVFTENELKLKLLNVGIGNLCNAMLVSNDLNAMVNTLLIADKTIKPAFFKKCLDTFVHFKNTNNFNLLHVKRSGDFGQVAMVKVLNEEPNKVRLNYGYGKDKKKEIPRKDFDIQAYDTAEKAYILLTGDQICAANATFNKARLITTKNGMIEFQKGVEPTSSVVSHDISRKVSTFESNIVSNLAKIHIPLESDIPTLTVAPTITIENVDEIVDNYYYAYDEKRVATPSNQEIINKLNSAIGVTATNLFRVIIALQGLVISNSGTLKYFNEMYENFKTAYDKFATTQNNQTNELQSSDKTTQLVVQTPQDLLEQLVTENVDEKQNKHINQIKEYIFEGKILPSPEDIAGLINILSFQDFKLNNLKSIGIQFPPFSGLDTSFNMKNMLIDASLGQLKVMDKVKASFQLSKPLTGLVTVGSIRDIFKREMEKRSTQRVRGNKTATINETESFFRERFNEYVHDYTMALNDMHDNVKSLYSTFEAFFNSISPQATPTSINSLNFAHPSSLHTAFLQDKMDCNASSVDFDDSSSLNSGSGNDAQLTEGNTDNETSYASCNNSSQYYDCNDGNCGDECSSRIQEGGDSDFPMIDFRILLSNSKRLMSCPYIGEYFFELLQFQFDQTIIDVWEFLTGSDILQTSTEANQNGVGISRKKKKIVKTTEDTLMSTPSDDITNNASMPIPIDTNTTNASMPFEEFRDTYFCNVMAQLYIFHCMQEKIDSFFDSTNPIFEYNTLILNVSEGLRDALSKLLFVYRFNMQNEEKKRNVQNIPSGIRIPNKDRVNVFDDELKKEEYSQKITLNIHEQSEKSGNVYKATSNIFIAARRILKTYSCPTEPEQGLNGNCCPDFNVQDTKEEVISPSDNPTKIFNEYILKLNKELDDWYNKFFKKPNTLYNDVCKKRKINATSPSPPLIGAIAGGSSRLPKKLSRRMTQEEYHKKYYVPYWLKYYRGNVKAVK